MKDIRFPTVYYKILIFVTIFIFITFTALTQNSFEIRFLLKNQSDSTFILARHFGDKIQLVDSTVRDENGGIVFKGLESLPGGVYILATGKKNKLLEFLVTEDQHFTIEADFSSYEFSIQCNDSRDNQLFFEHLHLSNTAYAYLNKIKTQKETGEISPERFQFQTDSINSLLNDYRQGIIRDSPDFFISSIFKALKEPTIPQDIIHDNEKSYHFYKHHFWDNIDLNDDRMLRIPVFSQKLETYFSKLIPPVPDSVIVAIDELIAKANTSNEVRDYLIWHFTSDYQNHSVMGMDKVFVHLSDTYFRKMQIANTTESVKQKILERSNQLRKLLIGSPAPDLWLIDTSGAYRSFKEIKADYTALIFWDFECGVCKKELDALLNIVNSRQYPLEVFAIGTNSNLEGWKDYIIRNKLNWFNVNGTRSMTQDFHDLYDIYGTPVIYLLDKHKTIIAKRIKSDQIGLVIESLTKSPM